jgi:L-serine dehydratase
MQIHTHTHTHTRKHIYTYTHIHANTNIDTPSLSLALHSYLKNDPELFERVDRVRVELFGSLALTGEGHGTLNAIVAGLCGEEVTTTDTDQIGVRGERALSEKRLFGLGGALGERKEEEKKGEGSKREERKGEERKEEEIHGEEEKRGRNAGGKEVGFDGFVLHRDTFLPFHSNAMRFWALDARGDMVHSDEYYSIGGGFIVQEGENPEESTVANLVEFPFPYRNARELLEMCEATGKSIDDLVFMNECALRPAEEVRAGVLNLWKVMDESIRKGCR